MNRPDHLSILPKALPPHRHERAAALHRRAAGLLLLMGALLGPAATGAPPPTDWRLLLPSEVVGLSPDSFDVAHGADTFVGVGGFGVIYTSRDGLKWARTMSGTLDSLRTVAFGGGKFVAGGGTEFHTSADGISWDHHAGLGEAIALFNIRYQGGLFVATGIEYLADGRIAGLIYTSPNGIQWTRCLLLPPPAGFSYVNPKGIAHGNGRFVVTAGIGRDDGTYTERVSTFSSPDGIAWSPTATPVVESSSAVFSHDIAFSGGQFVLVESARTWTSPDGAAWQLRHELDAAWFSRGIVAAGNRFVSVAERFQPADLNDRAGVALVSDDGISWQSSPLPTGLVRLFSEGVTFFAVGEQTALSSPDGLAWTGHFTPDPLHGTTPALRDVTYGKHGFLAVGHGGTILASRDGTSWEKRSSGTPANLSDVVHAGDRYMAAGSNGTLIASTDGLTWTAADLEGTTHSLGPLAHGGGRYVLLSRDITDGFFWTSEDGLDWRVRFSAALVTGSTSTYYSSVTFGNGHFVAAGSGGLVAVSANGISWQRISLPEPYLTASLRRIAFARDRFLLPTGTSPGHNALLTSADGLTWIVLDPDSYSSVGYGDGNLVAVRGEFQNAWGDDLAPIASSSDGTNWTTAAPYRFSHEVIASNFVYGSGRFVGVGSRGDSGFNSSALLLVSGFAPSPTVPQLEFRNGTAGLTLRIRGEPGTTWNLQRSPTLSDWHTLHPITLETDALELVLTPLPGGQGFWRLTSP